MKKIIIILITAALIILGGSAFAQELTGQDPGGRQYNRLANKSQIMDFAGKVQQKRQAISQNREQLAVLQRQLNSRIKQARSRIKDLKKDPGSVDTKRLDTVRSAFNSITGSQKTLAGTEGLLKKKGIELRQAKLQRKPAVFLETLDEIIIIQQKRIEALQKMITDLERLESALG